MNTTSASKVGFVYTVEQIRDGKVIDSEVVHNLVPSEGIEYILRGALLSGTPITAWNVGLFQGDYMPDADVTGASVAVDSEECNAYTVGGNATIRAGWTGAYAAGTADNSASRAEFTMTGDVQVFGAFLASNGTKGASTGTLLSIARFASPKNLETTDILRITAGITLLSA